MINKLANHYLGD